MLNKPHERAEKEGTHPSAPDASMARRKPQYSFYCLSGCTVGDISPLPPRYSWFVWRPSLLSVLPPGLPGIRLKMRFLFRWLLRRAHLLAGVDCGALLIRYRSRIVHYSGFTPRYWRFPFIADDDLQIGDTWTAPAHRGAGLALFALGTIVALTNRPGRRFWYVVEGINQPSIRVARKAGFALAAEGVWIKPWGLKLPGYYVPLELCRSCAAKVADRPA